MHSLFLPSPFGTTTIGADQLESLSLITPASSNLSISALTQSWCFKARVMVSLQQGDDPQYQ